MLKRILVAFLAVILLFSCCCAKQQPENISIIKIPDSETAQNINGYITSSAPETTESAVVYYASTTTGKFHLQNCTYAQKTKDEYLFKTENRSLLIDDGFLPCNKCHP